LILFLLVEETETVRYNIPETWSYQNVLTKLKVYISELTL